MRVEGQCGEHVSLIRLVQRVRDHLRRERPVNPDLMEGGVTSSTWTSSVKIDMSKRSRSEAA